jgi:outer membrane protein assembly factor BamB
MQWFNVSMIPCLVTSACRLIARQGKIIFVGCLAAVMLTSCGGGGGGGTAGPVTSTLSFPLKSGLRAMVANGSSIDFNVSGTCSGTANITSSTPIPATFGNISGFSTANVFNANFPNCNPPSLYSTSIDYYDTNYDPLGGLDSSGNYGVYTTPLNIPASVKVGDAGAIGTKNYYSDSSRLFTTGHDDFSYVVLPDTANSAIVNMIDKSYELSGVLTSTEQDKYRINASGALTLISSDIKFANGSTTHFVMTAIPDTRPPTILSTSPANYSTNSPAYASITATFSEAMAPSTVNAAVFTLMDGTIPVSGTVKYSGNTFTFTPSAPLTPTTIYTARIATGVKDMAGNAMSSNYSWQFQTAALDTTPPTISSTSPAYSASNVAINTTITVIFSKPIDPTTMTTAEFMLMNGSTPISGTVTSNGTTATFTLSAPLNFSTTYTATITSGVKDVLGNVMGSNFSWSFTTGAAPDITPPTVSSTSPTDSTTGAGLRGPITATFSETLTTSTVNASTFTLMNGSTPISGTVTYSGTTATFIPSTPLTMNTLYTATITTGVMDLSNNPMSTNYSWTFTTFSPNPSPLPPLRQSVAYQNDYAHSGFVTFGTPITFPANPTWSVTLNGAVSYPLIAGGKVYVATASPVTSGGGSPYGTSLYALDEQTGSVAWGPINIPGTYFWSGLAYDHGKIFVINFDGLMRSFDAATGLAGWSSQLPAQYAFTSPPTAINGVVYVGGAGSGGTHYAVDETNGNVLWKNPVSNGDHSSPSVSSDGVFVTYPCQAYKFDPLSGTSLWHYSGPCSGGGGRTPVYANGLLYMRDWSSTFGLIFNAATGIQSGNFSESSSAPIPAFSTQIEFFQNNGTLQGIDLTTRNVLWSFAGDGYLVSAPIVIDQYVIVGSSSGNVYALDATTGTQIWNGAAGAAISGPDEQSVSQPLTGFGAGEGYLVVPAGKVLSAWHLVP